MDALRKINLVLVTALSITAGLPKIGRIPQEVQFFADTGCGTSALVAFGILQLGGGAMLIFRSSRVPGAVVAAVMFLASAVMLLRSGEVAFGLVSLLPVVMAAIVAGGAGSRQNPTPESPAAPIQ